MRTFYFKSINKTAEIPYQLCFSLHPKDKRITSGWFRFSEEEGWQTILPKENIHTYHMKKSYKEQILYYNYDILALQDT